MKAAWVAAVFLWIGLFAQPATAQTCPAADRFGADALSRARVLSGRLIYHDGIRQWFELKLDRPQCGQSSIQLTAQRDDYRPIERLRGCHVSSRGKIGVSGTGYFSRDVYQNVERIEPTTACKAQPPLADHSHRKPARGIRAYRVEMLVNYRPGDHPIRFDVRSGGKALRPWRAYASYYLTGSFVLYGHCADGFVIDRVFGTREALGSDTDHWRGENGVAFDPEKAANAGRWDQRLGFTCVRALADPPPEAVPPRPPR